MGLDCSHDAFHGAYSAFNRFRQIVAKATGGSFPPHYEDRDDRLPDHWYWGPTFSAKTHHGLKRFFMHSDCDGYFSPRVCKQVADDLEAVLPLIEVHDDGGGGHIERDGGYVAVTKRFIAGCRAAYARRQRLRFH